MPTPIRLFDARWRLAGDNPDGSLTPTGLALEATTSRGLDALQSGALLAAGLGSAAALTSVPDSSDARVRLLALDDDTHAAIIFLLEPQPGRHAAVLLAVHPLEEARELARAAVLQVNPVNGLVEIVSARSAEEAAEERSTRASRVRERAKPPTRVGWMSLTEEENSALMRSHAESTGSELPETEPAELPTGVPLAELPPDEEGLGWVGVVSGSGANRRESFFNVTREATGVTSLEDAPEIWSNPAVGYDIDATLYGLGLSHDALHAARTPSTYEDLVAAADDQRNAWEGAVVRLIADAVALPEIMHRLGIVTREIPAPPEVSEEQWAAHAAAVEVAFQRAEADGTAPEFPDYPQPLWEDLGAAASDAAVLAALPASSRFGQFGERIPAGRTGSD